MSTINSIPFRSTIFYRTDGTVAPIGTVFTISTNGLLNFSNSLSLNTLSASSITGNITTLSSITASTILTTGNNIALGQSVAFPNRYLELGTDVTDSVYLDFHSKDSTLSDYSTRIQSLGGATTGTGALNTTASTIGLMASSGVGIGTTNPAGSLHVYGAGISASYTSYQVSVGNSSSVRNLLIGVDGVSASLQSVVSLTTTPSPAWLTLNPSGGNVGIGTNSPGSTLEVYTNGGIGGTTQINITSFAGAATTTNTSVLNLRIQGAGAGMVDNIISAQYSSSGVGTYSLAFKPLGTTVMSILGSGSVGIGSTLPNTALDVTGGIVRAGRFETATTTTASIANGAAIDVSQANLGVVITGMCFISVQPTTTGQFYATYIANLWSPTITAVSLLLANGIVCSVVANNLRITNNTGSAFTFKVTLICISSFL